MIKKYLIAYFVVMVMFITVPSLTAATITVDKALELAGENSNSIVSAANSLAQAQLEEENKWNILFPAFSLSSATATSDSLENYFSDNLWAQTFSASMTVGFNGAVPDTLDATELSTQASFISQEMTKQGIETQVQSLFYFLLASEKNIDIQQQALELAEKQYQQMQTNYKNGYVSELQLMQSRLAMENAKPGISSAVLSYEQNLMIFRDLLGLDAAEDIKLEGSLDYIPVKLDGDKLVSDYLAGRWDVRMQNTTIEIQKNALELKKRTALWPTVGLQTTFSETYSDFTEVYSSSVMDHEWTDNLALTLSVSWNPDVFLKGSSTQVGINDQETVVTNAELNLKDSLESAEREIRTAVLQLDSYAGDLNVAALNVELSEKTYDMTNESFLKGTTEILDLEDARQDLSAARQSYLTSLYQYKNGLISLASYINTDLDSLIESFGTAK